MAIREIKRSTSAFEHIDQRIEGLTKAGLEEMKEAGNNFGHTLWLTPATGGLVWFSFKWLEVMKNSPITEVDINVLCGSLVAAGLCGYFGLENVFEGIHHVRSHQTIIQEIASLRSSIARRYDRALQGE